MAVFPLINVKSTTLSLDDYDHHSVRSSFLQDSEVDEFVSALRETGFYAHHFADERDFFSWVLAGEFEALNLPIKLVYSAALNGTGPGRRTLVPAFCAHFGLKTLNSDAYACAINRHKFHSSRLLECFGVQVPRSWYFVPGDGWLDNNRPPSGLPVVPKATYEGSSLGVDHEFVGPFSPTVEDHVSFLATSLRQPITVQELIAGYEVEVPVIRLSAHRALGCGVLCLNGASRLGEAVLSYDQAWDDSYSYTDDHDLPDSVMEALCKTAERATRLFNFVGISRVDFRVNGKGEHFVIDVSTTPHLTRSNAVAFLFLRAGLRYRDVLTALVAAGCLKHGLIYSSDQNSSSESKNPRP